MSASSDGLRLGRVVRIRAELGLPPLKPGYLVCLGCSGLFMSWDMRQNRVCSTCQSAPEWGPTARDNRMRNNDGNHARRHADPRRQEDTHP